MMLPDFDLSGRVALVTGAARGIGLSIANTLAAAGAAVVIQDIEQDLAEREAAAIITAGGRAMGIGGDATDASQANIWFKKTVEHFGKLDILVNNASIQSNQDFLEQPMDDFRRQFEANVYTLSRLCQLAIPPMRAVKWGRILNIGSIQGRRGNGFMAPYAMTKAAVENLTYSLARRFGRDGITVNCLSPGWMITHRNRHDFDSPEKAAENGRRIPIPRCGQPEDCIGAALLLCSNAGAYITGQTLGVDGGMSI